MAATLRITGNGTTREGRRCTRVSASAWVQSSDWDSLQEKAQKAGWSRSEMADYIIEHGVRTALEHFDNDI